MVSISRMVCESRLRVACKSWSLDCAYPIYDLRWGLFWYSAHVLLLAMWRCSFSHLHSRQFESALQFSRSASSALLPFGACLRKATKAKSSKSTHNSVYPYYLCCDGGGLYATVRFHYYFIDDFCSSIRSNCFSKPGQTSSFVVISITSLQIIVISSLETLMPVPCPKNFPI